MDAQSHETTKAGEPIQLTPIEFKILFMLAMNASRVIPYASLVEHAWGYDSDDANLLRTHITHIRQKLGLPLLGQRGIRVVPGVGYLFIPSS